MLPSLEISGRLATLTLRRPKTANRLDPEDLQAIVEHASTVSANREVLVMQVRGEGKYFCSGYNIGKLGGGSTTSFEDMVNAVEDARPITIAVLHGGLYGGATDLALACDFRIGSEATEMFMPAARLGLHYYPRGLQRYVSRLGVDTAKRLFLTAEKLDAKAMRECGFLTQLVSPEALESEVQRLTETLSGMAPLAILGMKKHLNRIARGALDVADLTADIAAADASEDKREGAAAWAEKRPPRFTGR
jgi:enoyl-CoA hydratase/carnithine racemase